jgi:hypothetical protein
MLGLAFLEIRRNEPKSRGSEEAKNELWVNSTIKIRITEINGRKMFKGMKGTLMERLADF